MNTAVSILYSTAGQLVQLDSWLVVMVLKNECFHNLTKIDNKKVITIIIPSIDFKGSLWINVKCNNNSMSFRLRNLKNLVQYYIAHTIYGMLPETYYINKFYLNNNILLNGESNS